MLKAEHIETLKALIDKYSFLSDAVTESFRDPGMFLPIERAVAGLFRVWDEANEAFMGVQSELNKTQGGIGDEVLALTDLYAASLYLRISVEEIYRNASMYQSNVGDGHIYGLGAIWHRLIAELESTTASLTEKLVFTSVGVKP